MPAVRRNRLASDDRASFGSSPLRPWLSFQAVYWTGRGPNDRHGIFVLGRSCTNDRSILILSNGKLRRLSEEYSAANPSIEMRAPASLNQYLEILRRRWRLRMKSRYPAAQLPRPSDDKHDETKSEVEWKFPKINGSSLSIFKPSFYNPFMRRYSFSVANKAIA